ncbi:hypothetical protein CHS0354_016272 [Potamilus streckersoni]|uniref:KY-like immunoglobulin-like domain-containing protein n=1 Tax=Potamilus streckersoni TaxID=2493646 RepID=A0AAE0RXH1_9BIVA|nr:hypothetical protein CHS0354_016272 [Potamilus streckersoni]
MGGASSVPSKTLEREVEDLQTTWILWTFKPDTVLGGLTYSESHCLWTNDIERLENIPPPHPSPTRKHEVFQLEKYKHVDRRADETGEKFNNKLVFDLVTHLTKDYPDDLSKARSIYRWITMQPVENMLYPDRQPDENTVLYQLWKLKHKQKTYAQVFSLLCGYANLPCVVIDGHMKGSTYDVGQELVSKHKGEWNAVLIDENWRLVNAFWGACVLTGNENEDFCYSTDENFFLTDPQHLIYTHFPRIPDWQLLDPQKSQDEFQKQAYLKDRFFNLEMRLLSNPNCTVEVPSGEAEFLFGLNHKTAINQSFMCIASIYDSKEMNSKAVELADKDLTLEFIQRPNEHLLSIKVRFPEVGTYKVEIVGKDDTVQQKDYDFDWIAIYKAVVRSIPIRQKFFPKPEPEGWGPGRGLHALGLKAITPLDGVIKTDTGEIELQYQIVDKEKAKGIELCFHLLPIGSDVDEADDANKFTLKNDVYTLKIQIDPGEYKLKIGEGSSGLERNVCNYNVISTRETVEEKKDDDEKVKEINRLREELINATEKKTLELLERAVDAVATRGFESYFPEELKIARELIARLKKIQKLMHEVMKLDQTTIAEIRSYGNPVREIHVVMQATLLLLGHFEEETKIWKNIQAIIGRTGKESLKRKIQELDMNKLGFDIALGAKKLMRGLELDKVVQQSAGAATFHAWMTGIIAEMEERHKDEIGNTMPRTTRNKIG